MVAGHLREKNGIYQMVLSYKDSSNKWRTKSISTELPVKGNKKKAEMLLAKAKKEFIPPIWDKHALLIDLIKHWVKYASLETEVYAEYKEYIENYITPYFTNHTISIGGLSAKDLEAFFNELIKRRKKAGSMKYLLKTTHRIILSALDYAVQSKWIAHNVADDIDPNTGQAEILFADFILEWLAIIKYKVQITTYAGYESNVKKRIEPYFREKGYTLNDLYENPKYIQDYYTYELEKNKVKPNTVIRRHANIHKCLEYAVHINLLKGNPADRVERPEENDFSAQYYNSIELAEMFKVFRGDPIEICVILASFYGMRRSEALGVKWSSIDFVNKTISVRHVVTDIYLDGKCQHISKDKTKSKSSTRKLPLVPQFETALVELYKKQQIQRELCGEDYSLEYLDYINKNDMGERLKPGYISDHFSLILKKNGLRKIRFHDLRHPYVKPTTKNIL